MSKVSFYEIFQYLWRFTFILMIPVLKSLLSYFSGQTDILSLITINSGLLIILFFWVYLEYKSKKYKINNNNLYIKNGFLIKNEQNFNIKKITLLVLKTTLNTKIFGASKISFTTKNNKNKFAKPVMTLKTNVSQQIFEKISNKKNLKKIYTPKIIRILLIAFLWSNPVTGLLFFIPLINKLGNILDEKLKNLVYSKVDFFINSVKEGIDPTVKGIIRIFLLGWIIAFLIHFLRFLRQKTYKTDENIFVEYGLINKTQIAIKIDEINFFMLKQTLFMNFFKIYNLYVNVLGDAKKESILIGVGLLKKEIEKILENFVEQEKKEILNSKINLISFLGPQSLLLVISLLMLFYSKNDITFLMVVFFIFFSLKWFIFKIKSFKNHKILLGSKTIEVKNSKISTMINVIIVKNKIKRIDTIENKKNQTSKYYFFVSSKKYFDISNIKSSSPENIYIN